MVKVNIQCYAFLLRTQEVSIGMCTHTDTHTSCVLYPCNLLSPSGRRLGVEHIPSVCLCVRERLTPSLAYAATAALRQDKRADEWAALEKQNQHVNKMLMVCAWKCASACEAAGNRTRLNGRNHLTRINNKMGKVSRTRKVGNKDSGGSFVASRVPLEEHLFWSTSHPGPSL